MMHESVDARSVLSVTSTGYLVGQRWRSAVLARHPEDVLGAIAVDGARSDEEKI